MIFYKIWKMKCCNQVLGNVGKISKRQSLTYCRLEEFLMKFVTYYFIQK